MLLSLIEFTFLAEYSNGTFGPTLPTKGLIASSSVRKYLTSGLAEVHAGWKTIRLGQSLYFAMPRYSYFKHGMLASKDSHVMLWYKKF